MNCHSPFTWKDLDYFVTHSVQVIYSPQTLPLGCVLCSRATVPEYLNHCGVKYVLISDRASFCALHFFFSFQERVRARGRGRGRASASALVPAEPHRRRDGNPEAAPGSRDTTGRRRRLLPRGRRRGPPSPGLSGLSGPHAPPPTAPGGPRWRAGAAERRGPEGLTGPGPEPEPVGAEARSPGRRRQRRRRRRWRRRRRRRRQRRLLPVAA